MLDMYDDKSGLLQQKLGSANIKELLKHGEIPSEEALRKLPDRLFALVMTTPEGGRLRKYAWNNAASTVASVVYFLENYTNLPPEAVKTAATNLVGACETYDLAVPPQLKKLALLGAIGLGLSGMAARDVGRTGKQKAYGTLQRAGVPIPADPNAAWKMASVYVETDDLPVSAYQDAEIATISVPRMQLTTHDDIAKAANYYIDSRLSWSPEQRVGFCRPLLDQAVKLGMAGSLHEEIRRYGKRDPGTPEQISAILDTREPYFKTAAEYSQYLGEVLAVSDANGDELATKLASIERRNHLASKWSSTLPDPWMVIFGLCKTAEYTFEDKGNVVTDQDLCHLPSRRTELLETFDPELVDALLQDPVAIFDSLPLDHKRVIMRIAKQKEQE